MVANYYQPGPNRSGDVRFRVCRPQHLEMFSEGPTPKWFVAENFVAGHPKVTADNWDGGVQFDEPDLKRAGSLTALIEKVRGTALSFPAPRITQQPAQAAADLVLAHAEHAARRDGGRA